MSSFLFKIDFFEVSQHFFMLVMSINCQVQSDDWVFAQKMAVACVWWKIICSTHRLMLLFFRPYSPGCLKHFRYVYGCRIMHRKTLKVFEIENITKTSEISDSVLSTLWNSLRVWTRADFLKLEFSILIILLPNIFGELFECIQNFCREGFLISNLKIWKINFPEVLWHFFILFMSTNYQVQSGDSGLK